MALEGKFAFQNPLELLVLGPLEDYDLMVFGVSLMPDCPQSEMLDVLNNLRNQYIENPQDIITPHWWKESSEQFRDEMNGKLDRMISFTDETPSEKDLQAMALEAYTSIWMEFISG